MNQNCSPVPCSHLCSHSFCQPERIPRNSAGIVKSFSINEKLSLGIFGRHFPANYPGAWWHSSPSTMTSIILLKWFAANSALAGINAVKSFQYFAEDGSRRPDQRAPVGCLLSVVCAVWRLTAVCRLLTGGCDGSAVNVCRNTLTMTWQPGGLIWNAAERCAPPGKSATGEHGSNQTGNSF